MNWDYLCIQNIIFFIKKSYQPGSRYTVPEHSSYRLMCVLSGDGKFVFANHVFHASSGDLVLLPPNQAYSLNCCGDAKWEFCAVGFTAEGLACHAPVLFRFPTDARLHEQFCTGYDIFTEKETGYILRIKSRLYSIFHRLAIGELSCEDNNFRRTVLRYISHHYGKKITAKDLAEKAGYSLSYFNKLFSAAMGASPIQYLNRFRVERAKELLEAGFFTTAEIAEKCGFENVYYFSHVFKQLTRMTPGQYAKKVTSNHLDTALPTSKL